MKVWFLQRITAGKDIVCSKLFMYMDLRCPLRLASLQIIFTLRIAVQYYGGCLFLLGGGPSVLWIMLNTVEEYH